MTLRRVLATLSALAVIYLVWPRSVPVVPQWMVRVRTEAGAAVPGVVCRQSWRHDSIGIGPVSEELTTDARGQVIFPARRLRIPYLVYAVRLVWSVVKFGIHYEGGTHAYVSIGILGSVSGCSELAYFSRAGGSSELVSECVVATGFEKSLP